MSITQIDKQYVANTYNRFPVEIVRGQGSECWDANGKRYSGGMLKHIGMPMQLSYGDYASTVIHLKKI